MIKKLCEYQSYKYRSKIFLTTIINKKSKIFFMTDINIKNINMKSENLLMTNINKNQKSVE